MSLKKFLITLALCLAGVWLFIYTLKSANLKEVAFYLKSFFSWKFVLLLIVAFFSIIFISAYRCYLILKHKRQNPKFWNVIWAELVGFAFSYLTPVTFIGGEPLRYAVLREGSNIEPVFAISAIAIEKMILFLMVVVAFLLGIAFFFVYIPLSFEIQMGVLSFLLIGMMVFLWFYYKVRKIIKQKGLLRWLLDRLYLSKLKSVKKYGDNINEIEQEIVVFFTKRTKTRQKIFWLSVLEVIVDIGFIWLVVWYVTGYLSLGKVLVINNAINFSALMPLPAALGSSEISQSYVFSNIGLVSEKGISFSLFLRTIYLVFSLAGVIIFVIYQINYIKDKLLKVFQKWIFFLSQNGC